MAANNTSNRGFAAMDDDKVSEIAKQGNQAQSSEDKAKGAAHIPTKKKVEGGKKGGSR